LTGTLPSGVRRNLRRIDDVKTAFNAAVNENCSNVTDNTVTITTIDVKKRFLRFFFILVTFFTFFNVFYFVNVFYLKNVGKIGV